MTSAQEFVWPDITTPTGPQATIVRLADVEPQHVDWLWPGRMPLGKLVTLDGDPSLGKSTLTLSFAATLSRGGLWPDGTQAPVGATLILSAEDGLADTIRPRLDAAGADPSRVFALTEIATYDDDGRATIRTPTLSDLPLIEPMIVERRVKLVVIDVLMAYMPGGVDSYRDQDVRSVLHRLSAMADRTGCVILLLRHLNKTGAGSAMYRGGGSIGIVGAARAGYLVARDPDDDTRVVFACTKNNLAARPEALAYQLVSAGEVARVEWLGTVDTTADDLLRGSGDEEERSARDEAQAWLNDYLIDAGGEASSKDIFTAAKRDGHSDRTMRRAKDKLRIQVTKVGFGGGWVWRLKPEGGQSAAKDAEHVQSNGVATLGTFGLSVATFTHGEAAEPAGGPSNG